MSYIQLIEKAVLPTSLWLTFWDLEDKTQLSLEIAAPTETYEVGHVFRLDRDAKYERLALQPVADPAHLTELNLLIPAPVGGSPSGRPVVQKTISIRETSGGTARDHSGFLNLVS